MPKTNSQKVRAKRRKNTDRASRGAIALMHEIEQEVLHFHRIVEKQGGKVAHASDLKITIKEAVQCLRNFDSIISV